MHSFKKIDLNKSKPYKDFGKGFYLAENKNDATAMAIKNSPVGFVYHYTIDIDAFKTLNVMDFGNGYTEEWLDFVIKCRSSFESPHEYDIVIGATADGKAKEVFKKHSDISIISNYKHLILNEVSKRIFDIQYLFNTQKAIDMLCLIDVEEYGREPKSA